MTLTQALVALGIPTVLILLAGYGGYMALSIILGLKHNPLKVARFEAGNIPYGEGRLWYPLQYYGYILIYTSIEPLIVILLLLAPSAYYASQGLYLHFAVILGSFIALLYPIVYYGAKVADTINQWEVRR
ncbi:MAG: NADH-quinone oxidoreductase subunit A [Thermoprotei archaeon]